MPYESLGSFAAKFCRLNGISPREFRWFLDKLLDSTDWRSKGFNQSSINKLAQLLDEKVSIVASLGQEKLDLPGCYGSFSFNYLNGCSYLSFCPVCIKIGYHSSFHEYVWLKKCPIHNADLIRKLFIQHYGCPDFDSYVKNIDQLLDGNAPAWLPTAPNLTLENQLTSTSFIMFKRWVRAVQHWTTFIRKNNLVALYGVDYSLCDLEVLLGRIGWTIPIPKRINGLFRTRANRLEPMITDYPTIVVNKLASILSKVKYNNLTWFFKVTVAMADEKPKYREVAWKAIEELKREDKEHRCEWGWGKYEGWVSVKPSGWPYWALKTPFQLAVSELQREWTEFVINEDSTLWRNSVWLDYLYWARKFLELGYVSPLNSKDKSPDDRFYKLPFSVPIVRINFDTDLRGLLEDMLYIEVLSHLAEIRAWLKSIEKGGPPYERHEVPSSGNLFLEPERAYLCSWPV